MRGAGGLQPWFQERLVCMNVVAAVPVFILGSPCMHGWPLIVLRSTILLFVAGQLLGRLLLRNHSATHVVTFRCSICCINFGTWMLSYWWCQEDILWCPFMVFAHFVTGIWVKLLCGSFTKHHCLVSIAGNFVAYTLRVGASKEARAEQALSWMLQWSSLCVSLLVGLCAIGVLNFAGVRRKLLLLWRVMSTAASELENDSDIVTVTPPSLTKKSKSLLTSGGESGVVRNRSVADLRPDSSRFDDVVCRELVGRGSFGRVYKGSWRGTDVVVKVIPWTSSKDEAGPLLEAQLAAVLSHPCVVQTFKYSSGARSEVTDVQETWIVQEWCDLGTLGRLCSAEPLPAWEVVEIAQDVASGGAYLHSRGIIHGDLTASNILLKSTQTPGKGYVCKVCDFGLARVLNTDKSYLLTSHMGTVTHMPPEAFCMQEVTFRLTKSADVYAFGMLLYQAIARRPPFDGLTAAQVVVQVESGVRVELPPGTDKRLSQIFDQCTSASMDERPTFDDLLPVFHRLAESDDLDDS